VRGTVQSWIPDEVLKKDVFDAHAAVEYAEVQLLVIGPIRPAAPQVVNVWEVKEYKFAFATGI
jgi:hypothetical protein